MIRLLCFVLAVLAASIKSKMKLEAENVVLPHQLTVLRRRLQARIRLTNNDRRYLIVVYRWFPSILQVLTIIRPETHGFAERLIGSIRRECSDHIVVFGEAICA